MFNAIVRLCLTDILPTVNKNLKLPKQKDPNKLTLPSTSKNWSKVRGDMKTYITDIIQVKHLNANCNLSHDVSSKIHR